MFTETLLLLTVWKQLQVQNLLLFPLLGCFNYSEKVRISVNCLGCCKITPTVITVSVPLFPQAHLPMFTPTVDTEPVSKNTQQIQQAMIAPQNVSSWKFLGCSSSRIHFLAQLVAMAVKSLRSYYTCLFFFKVPTANLWSSWPYSGQCC